MNLFIQDIAKATILPLEKVEQFQAEMLQPA